MEIDEDEEPCVSCRHNPDYKDNFESIEHNPW